MSNFNSEFKKILKDNLCIFNITFYLCAVWQVRIPTASVINTCDTSIAHRYASIP